jgi:hypothetical protein
VSSPPNEPASLRDAPRILAVLLRIGFILGFLLTPVGLETRRKFLRSPAIAGFFIFVGLVAPLAGLILLLFRRPKPAGILAVIDAVLLMLAAPADQARLFFTVPPPPAVTVGESALALLGIGYPLYGFRASRETGESRRAIAAAS